MSPEQIDLYAEVLRQYYHRRDELPWSFNHLTIEQIHEVLTERSYTGCKTWWESHEALLLMPDGEVSKGSGLTGMIYHSDKLINDIAREIESA